MNRKRRICTAWARLSAFYVLFTAGATTAQTIVQSFDGDSGPGLAICQTGVSHCGFPDMNAAVNGKQVVQATWQNVSVFDYSGHLLRATPMATFIRNAGLDPIPAPRGANPSPARGPFEPHVLYDEFISRWIISVTGSSESLLVSATADPLASWGAVNLSCLDGGPCLNIDPAIHIGYDKNGVYYCAVHVGDSNPNTVLGVSYDCFAVPSAEVQGIAQGKSPTHINRAHNMPHEVFPAIDHNRKKAPGAPAFFLAKTCAIVRRQGPARTPAIVPSVGLWTRLPGTEPREFITLGASSWSRPTSAPSRTSGYTISLAAARRLSFHRPGATSRSAPPKVTG